MKRPFYHYIFLILIGLAGFMICLCFSLWLFEQHLYLPPFSSDRLCSLSFGVIVILCLLWMGVHWCVQSKKWYSVVFKVLALSLVLLITVWLLLFSWAFRGWAGDFQRCDSPAGEHSIVFENESQFAVEWGAVYIMTSPLTMEKVADLERPFYPSFDEINWYDTYAELIMGDETIRIPYDNTQ